MKKLSPKLQEMTKEEWRELGFYYISDDDKGRWDLHGSVNGLSNLISLIESFLAQDEVLGKHEHLLPHWYLTFEFTKAGDVSKRGLVGSKRDFQALNSFLRKQFEEAQKGDVIDLHRFYQSPSYKMFLHIHGDSFDPSSMDPQL